MPHRLLRIISHNFSPLCSQKGFQFRPAHFDSQGILEFNFSSYRKGDECAGSTENGLYKFLNDCVRNKTRVDNLIIFSDMVIGDGGRGGWDASSRAGLGTFQELFKEFRKLNPECLTVSVDINQTSGKSVFDRSLNFLQIAGWSEKIFE